MNTNENDSQIFYYLKLLTVDVLHQQIIYNFGKGFIRELSAAGGGDKLF